MKHPGHLPSLVFLSITTACLAGCASKVEYAKIAENNEENTQVILPEIGQTISTRKALELCRYYDLAELVRRIEVDSGNYNEWIFEGCSMTPTIALGNLINVPSLTEICLKHDLAYAYGDPGNSKERKQVDQKFYQNLTEAGASEFAAKALYYSVRNGGHENLCLSFSWAFANDKRCQ